MALKIIALLLLIYFAFAAFHVGRRVYIGRELAHNVEPFSYATDHSDKRILVVGDSLAVGTGATRAEDTIAGRIHQDFPHAEIINISQNGAEMKEVAEELNQVSGRFDLVVITGGANNIIHFRNFGEAKSDAELMVKNAKEKSDRVVWLASGNIGLAPIWPWPLGQIYTHKTRKYHAEFRSVAEEGGVQFVNLFMERNEDIFAKDPRRYYSSDGLHPSGDGYGVWYEALTASLYLQKSQSGSD